MDEKKTTVDLSLTETEVRVLFKDVRTSHFLRDESNEERLEYRRQLSSYRVRKGVAQASDAAARAPLWLYEKVCMRVSGFTLDGKDLMDHSDWRSKIPARVKEAVMNAYFLQIQADEGDEGNS